MSDALACLDIHLELAFRSFTRGIYEEKPCFVTYDAVMDKTLVISDKSENYAKAMAALTTLETLSTALMPPVIHKTGEQYDHHVLI